MNVTGSLISPKSNIHMMSLEEAEKRKYCACKYCMGIAGKLEWIRKKEEKGKIKFHYERYTDTLYIQTEVGFWKIYQKKETGKYLLFHRNTYKPEMTLKSAINGNYHRQHDIKATDSIISIVEYIIAHDRAKQIIADDYRKLPQDTRKQKHYFRKVEKREKLKKAQRLDRLFGMIEEQNKTKTIIHKNLMEDVK